MRNTESQVQKKPYPVTKIRLGDITGPCGNTNCPLAHKVKTYIKSLEAYKKEVGKVSGSQKDHRKKVCGKYKCTNDHWHPEKQSNDDKKECSDNGGFVLSGEICKNKKSKMNSFESSPSGYKTTAAYVNSLAKTLSRKKSTFGKNYIVENLTTNYNYLNDASPTSKCWCNKPPQASFGVQVAINTGYKHSSPAQSIGVNTLYAYNMSIKGPDTYSIYNACVSTQEPIDTECKCRPPKPTPPCKTFDCECITEMGNITARKRHKPYCPSYKHKSTCPVMMKKEDEEREEEEDEAEPLPYGLPPIQLGPCPVMGKPCANPDGFAKMYKTQALASLPASYSDAGKVCCSKEYERLKKAVHDYMKFEKDDDYRCINTFDVDTERRCCDKEQRLIALMGKDCCGTHKLAIQNKFKEEKR